MIVNLAILVQYQLVSNRQMDGHRTTAYTLLT